jgi:hypothetical protein
MFRGVLAARPNLAIPDRAAGNIAQVHVRFPMRSAELDEAGYKIHTRVFALAEE